MRARKAFSVVIILILFIGEGAIIAKTADLYYGVNDLGLNPPSVQVVPIDFQINYWKPYIPDVGSPDIQLGITVYANQAVVADYPATIAALAVVNNTLFNNVTAIFVSFEGAYVWFRHTNYLVNNVGIIEGGDIELYSDIRNGVHYYDNQSTTMPVVYWSDSGSYGATMYLYFNNGKQESLASNPVIDVQPNDYYQNEKLAQLNFLLTVAVVYFAAMETLLVGASIWGWGRTGALPKTGMSGWEYRWWRFKYRLQARKKTAEEVHP